MTRYESRLELLARVASLYYDQNKKQDEIGVELSVTRSAVSRLLTEARNKGVVEYIIHYPWRTSPDLEKRLQTTFNLEHVQVLVRNTKTYEEMLNGLGIIASQYLTNILSDLKTIGISWGSGLYHLVRNFKPQLRSDMEVTQLIGGTGMERGSSIGPLLAPGLAHSLGCACRFLHAPLIMKNEASRNALLEDPMIKETLDVAANVDIALIGIGGITAKLYNPYLVGYINMAELEDMQAAGIVGDVAGRHYNIQGEILEEHWVNKSYIGISSETLKSIKSVMAVAGDSAKGEGIYGALRGNLIDILITDDSAAQRVLQLHELYNKPGGQV